MGYEAEKIAIEERFDSTFGQAGGGDPAILKCYDNIDFEPTDDTAWARLSIRPADGNQVGMGSTNVHRYSGVIFIQIFVPKSGGLGVAMQLADEAADIWRGAQFSGITCRTPRVVNVGPDRDWYQVNVLTNFFRDE